LRYLLGKEESLVIDSEWKIGRRFSMRETLGHNNRVPRKTRTGQEQKKETKDLATHIHAQCKSSTLSIIFASFLFSSPFSASKGQQLYINHPSKEGEKPFFVNSVVCLSQGKSLAHNLGLSIGYPELGPRLP
jgi:hypothetical protein